MFRFYYDPYLIFIIQNNHLWFIHRIRLIQKRKNFLNKVDFNWWATFDLFNGSSERLFASKDGNMNIIITIFQKARSIFFIWIGRIQLSMSCCLNCNTNLCLSGREEKDKLINLLKILHFRAQRFSFNHCLINIRLHCAMAN